MRVSEVLNRVRAQTDAVRRTPPVRDGARPFSPPVDSTARPPARAPVASSGASPSLRALPHPAPAPVVLGARGGAGGWPATHQPPATPGFTRGGGQHRGGGSGALVPVRMSPVPAQSPPVPQAQRSGYASPVQLRHASPGQRSGYASPGQLRQSPGFAGAYGAPGGFTSGQMSPGGFAL